VTFQQPEHRQAHVLPAIQQHQADRAGHVGERSQGIAGQDRHRLGDAGFGQVRLRRGCLRRAELGGEDPAGAVVGYRGGQVDGRDAEGGAELDDRVRAARPDQGIQQAAARLGDGHVDVLHHVRALLRGGAGVVAARWPGRPAVIVERGGGEQPVQDGLDPLASQGIWHERQARRNVSSSRVSGWPCCSEPVS
jgi:hypothetical protein